jgi:uncharacterized protein YbgA (DUF1722 family)
MNDHTLASILGFFVQTNHIKQLNQFRRENATRLMEIMNSFLKPDEETSNLILKVLFFCVYKKDTHALSLIFIFKNMH